MINVLHVCNDFTGSKVHAELYKKLSNIGITQYVYTAYRNRNLEGNNAFEAVGVKIVYASILKYYHRVFFHKKINDIFSDIEKRIDLQIITCVHATTLFSDGAVALKLKKKYNIPYIVAVRNTDINDFLKYAPHLWRVHQAVLREASKIVFITPSIKERLLSHWTLHSMGERMKQKCVVLSNGINDFWHEHFCAVRCCRDNAVAYIGRFDNNKNVIRLIKAVLMLHEELPDVKLNLVGGGGRQEKQVKAYVKKYPDVIKYWGKIYDKEELMRFYRKNKVFAMPSKTETFGLVYIEALSQGLPVLYTKNEGIDHLFDYRVGEGVAPSSIIEIKNALCRLLHNTSQYNLLSFEELDRFDWNQIALEYKSLYQEISCK